MGRSLAVNHFNRAADALAPASNFPRLAMFLPQNLGPWILSYLKYVFTRRFPFADYANSGKDGVYRIAPLATADNVTIAIAGDWATGTQEAKTIADLMCNRPDSAKPDFTIHLGDIYYVGDDPEIAENCFGESRNGLDGVVWPHGRQGSRNGNHEMYANGKPYYQISAHPA
jgi:hypothetical protein